MKTLLIMISCLCLISLVAWAEAGVSPETGENWKFASDSNNDNFWLGDNSANEFQNYFNQKIILPYSHNDISKVQIQWHSSPISGTPSALGQWYIGLALSRNGTSISSLSFNPDSIPAYWQTIEIPLVTVNQGYIYLMVWHTINTDNDGTSDWVSLRSGHPPIDTDENLWTYEDWSGSPTWWQPSEYMNSAVYVIETPLAQKASIIAPALPMIWGAIAIWSISFIVLIGVAFIGGVQNMDFSGLLAAVILSIGILIALLVTLAVMSGFILL